MDNADEKWQWVDEDPIEKLLHPPQSSSAKFRAEGHAQFQRGRFEEAADAFRRALRDNPEHAEALAGLGSCLLHLDAAEEALSCFERLLEAGGCEAALLGMAVALQKLARYEEADRAYRELLEINPDSDEPLANLIALSVARQDAAAVAEYSGRLLRVQPRSKAALQGLAMLAMRNGDRTAATEYYTRLVEVDPDSFEGWANLRHAQQRIA
jgi:Flp pilus assembly protein TadD